MTNKKSNDSRRKLLKSLAAGSGAVVAGKNLPESWSKPVIDTVMIPAHAETTNDNEADAPAVLCGGCYFSEGGPGGGSSYLLPEGLAPGIVQGNQVTKFRGSPDCTGEGEPKDGKIFALARNEAEAQSFLNCGENENTAELATRDGSDCSLWECD